MADHRNRRILGFVGLLILAAAALAVCTGAAVFGTHRSDEAVFDPTLVRWWNEGGWESFAVVVAVGVIAAIAGLALIRSQLHRNDGHQRTPALTFAHAGPARGETVLRAAALSHSLEEDLERIPDVDGAMVGLFGLAPDIELRTVLDITDDADLDQLPAQVDEVLDRMAATTGLRPDPVLVTLRFREAKAPRQLA